MCIIYIYTYVCKDSYIYLYVRLYMLKTYTVILYIHHPKAPPLTKQLEPSKLARFPIHMEVSYNRGTPKCMICNGNSYQNG